MGGHQQEMDWDKLKTHCSDVEKLYSGEFKRDTLNSPLEKISSPTTNSCVFSAKKIPQNDAVNVNTDPDEKKTLMLTT